jgi:ubiquitin carboxyl-terminal hydrolase 47
MLAQGEFVYEVYAVLIHNGGAFGGHYFAYIKS